jgi:hypothetical protein
MLSTVFSQGGQAVTPQIDLIKRLINSRFSITIIQTEDSEAVVDFFRELSDIEKREFFIWKAGRGIHRLMDENSNNVIEETKTLIDALECMAQSQHFGHFLLINDESIFKRKSTLDMINKIINQKDKSFRKVFIIGKQPNIPSKLKSKVVVVRLSTRYSGQVT